MSITERRRLLRAAKLLIDAAYALDEADEDAFAELASRAAQDLADARRPLTRWSEPLRRGSPEYDADKFTPEGRDR